MIIHSARRSGEARDGDGKNFTEIRIMGKANFIIATDSTGEMPLEYYKEHEGEDGQPIDTEAFYKALAAGKMPTTYQVTAEQAKTHLLPYVKAGNDVLVSAFSSGLSGTYGSFCVAAKELSEEFPERKIMVIDSLCASLGHGLFLH